MSLIFRGLKSSNIVDDIQLIPYSSVATLIIAPSVGPMYFTIPTEFCVGLQLYKAIVKQILDIINLLILNDTSF
jgi:hypothetical protein